MTDVTNPDSGNSSTKKGLESLVFGIVHDSSGHFLMIYESKHNITYYPSNKISKDSPQPTELESSLKQLFKQYGHYVEVSDRICFAPASSAIVKQDESGQPKFLNHNIYLYNVKLEGIDFTKNPNFVPVDVNDVLKDEERDKDNKKYSVIASFVSKILKQYVDNGCKEVTQDQIKYLFSLSSQKVTQPAEPKNLIDERIDATLAEIRVGNEEIFRLTEQVLQNAKTAEINLNISIPTKPPVSSTHVSTKPQKDEYSKNAELVFQIGTYFRTLTSKLMAEKDYTTNLDQVQEISSLEVELAKMQEAILERREFGSDLKQFISRLQETPYCPPELAKSKEQLYVQPKSETPVETPVASVKTEQLISQTALDDKYRFLKTELFKIMDQTNDKANNPDKLTYKRAMTLLNDIELGEGSLQKRIQDAEQQMFAFGFMK